ncbi:hypothetical protein BS47DRAFT_1364272 [Hydnum rufescens UP504]|uniref:Uncharacterized protein n=1 Tax=Hydnum rufescens UP504 TaxID=1448309 RepID=A0A9P6ARX5_9AGAM|nr:hypothetical protein BS47DRAFT_1364272 [Hydnum rufescens UP504]
MDADGMQLIVFRLGDADTGHIGSSHTGHVHRYPAGRPDRVVMHRKESLPQSRKREGKTIYEQEEIAGLSTTHHFITAPIILSCGHGNYHQIIQITIRGRILEILMSLHFLACATTGSTVIDIERSLVHGLDQIR